MQNDLTREKLDNKKLFTRTFQQSAVHEYARL